MLLLSPQGKNPTEDWKVIGSIKKVYDKPTKGYVFSCEGGTTNKMQLPKELKRNRTSMKSSRVQSVNIVCYFSEYNTKIPSFAMLY